jgi:hypothetical protein
MRWHLVDDISVDAGKQPVDGEHVAAVMASVVRKKGIWTQHQDGQVMGWIHGGRHDGRGVKRWGMRGNGGRHPHFAGEDDGAETEAVNRDGVEVLMVLLYVCIEA